MKKHLLTLLGLLVTVQVFAHEFSYTYQGQTLLYKVISEEDKTCMTGWNSNIHGDVVIPSVAIDGDTEYEVKEIGEASLGWNNHLTSVTIPNTVTSIGVCAFYECVRLTSVEIPNSVTNIGAMAFGICLQLASIEIPNSVITIGGAAFVGCAFGPTIYIPESVVDLASGAFGGCEALTEIMIDENNPNYCSVDGVVFNKDCTTLIQFPSGLDCEYNVPNSVTLIADNAFACSNKITGISIPNSVTTIGESAFEGCYGLTTFSIPNSVTTIGESTFEGCYGLTTFSIPNSVITIGYRAFYGCSGLTTLYLPNSVTTIGDKAFDFCSRLTSVYYDTEDPREFGSGIFQYEAKKRATLYVPELAVGKCKKISPWKDFSSIVADYSGIENLSNNIENEEPCEVYNLAGVKVADSTEGLNAGLYIVRQGSNVKKISVK